MSAVVVAGNPLDGLTIYGPFDHTGDAVEWAANNDLSDTPYWVTMLESPFPPFAAELDEEETETDK